MIRPRNRHRRPLPAFENGTLPKAWLDEVFEGRPAFFLDSSAHSGWVSGRALQIAGEIVYRRD